MSHCENPCPLSYYGYYDDVVFDNDDLGRAEGQFFCLLDELGNTALLRHHAQLPL